MKGERQSGQTEQWSSPPSLLVEGGESVRSSEKGSDIVALSLKDGQAAADFSGHGLHTVASAAEASV